MKMEILPNRNLKLSMERGDKSLVRTLLDRWEGNDKGFMYDMLDQLGWLGNAQLQPVKPEDIAALTDAPIVSDDIEYEDDGTVIVHGNVWWYTKYEMKHFADDLLEQGYAIFQFAPPVVH